MRSFSHSIDDYRREARKRLPRMVFDYLEGGADDELALRLNRSAFDDWELRPQRLVDVSCRDLSVSIHGQQIPLPFVIAPTGLNSSFWPGGDLALAKAAAKTGIPFALSTASNMSIEQVASGADGDLWFQLYVVHRELAASLVSRARAARYSTLVLTVDVAVNGIRHRDLRNGFAMPFQPGIRAIADGISHPGWLWNYVTKGAPRLGNFASPEASDTASQAALLRREMDASFNWDDFRRLRDAWPGKLVVKGILTAPDAKRCAEEGADGVVVSNHGGRQLAALPTPISALTSIKDSACDTSALLDGGIRWGPMWSSHWP